MHASKINLYKLQTKKRNFFIYFISTLLFFSKIFSDLNEKFSMMFKNNIVSLIHYFAEACTFEFFTIKSSNIIYREFSFFFSNLFFTSFFIFIFVDFSLAFIVFFFVSFFYLFAAVLQHWVEKSSRQFVLLFSSNVFEKNDFFVEIVSL